MELVREASDQVVLYVEAEHVHLMMRVMPRLSVLARWEQTLWELEREFELLRCVQRDEAILEHGCCRRVRHHIHIPVRRCVDTEGTWPCITR